MFFVNPEFIISSSYCSMPNIALSLHASTFKNVFCLHTHADFQVINLAPICFWLFHHQNFFFLTCLLIKFILFIHVMLYSFIVLVSYFFKIWTVTSTYIVKPLMFFHCLLMELLFKEGFFCFCVLYAIFVYLGIVFLLRFII